MVPLNEIKEKVFILTSGGFSVKTLSVGLRYIEKGFIELTTEDYTDIDKEKKQDIKKEFSILNQIIDFVNKILISKQISIEEIKRLLYVLLTRFKSSGDHGTAMATKFINEELNKPTIYLTGDQLAYVYSIANEIPTLFRFFAGKGDDKKKKNKGDDKKESGNVGRSHFLGFHSGNIKEDEVLQKKYGEIYGFFKEKFSDSLKEIESDIEVLNTNVSVLNNELKILITELLELTHTQNKVKETIETIRTKKEYIGKTIQLITVLDCFISTEGFNDLTKQGETRETKERLKPVYNYLHSIAKLRGYIFIYSKIDDYNNIIDKMLKSHLDTYENEVISLPVAKLNETVKTTGRARKPSFKTLGLFKFEAEGQGIIKDINEPNITYEEFVEKLALARYDEGKGKSKKKTVSRLTKIIEIKKMLDKKMNDLLNDMSISLPICKISLNEIVTIIAGKYINNLIEKTEDRIEPDINRYKFVKDHIIKMLFRHDTKELTDTDDEYNRSLVANIPQIPLNKKRNFNEIASTILGKQNADAKRNKLGSQ
jgi:regulator of replication initiation timing